jgi:hypothetical protein
MERRITLALAAAGFTLGGETIASAHIQISTPLQRDTGQKIGPCGSSNGIRSQNVCTYRPGATIVVTWDETIEHPGHFRISFDQDGEDDFADPESFEDVDGGPSVLVDGIADRSVVGGDPTYTQEVTLPDVECQNCTLQLIQLMTDKPPYGDGNDIYYQCADLVLSEAAPADPDDGCAAAVEDDGTDEGEVTCAAGGSSSSAALACLLLGLLSALRRRGRPRVAPARWRVDDAPVLRFCMADSIKDALRKLGLVPEAPAPRRVSKKFLEELPDDETLPPLFEAPAPNAAPPHFEPRPRSKPK